MFITSIPFFLLYLLIKLYENCRKETTQLILFFTPAKKILDTIEKMNILYIRMRNNYINLTESLKKGGDDSIKEGQSFIHIKARALTTLGYNLKKEGYYV